MTERLPFHFSLACIGERNGNPLQCSCLENPRDGGDWWAAVCGVTQSRTRLKRLSSSSCARLVPCFPPHLPLHSTYCLCPREVSYAPTCKFLLGPLHYRRLGARPTSSSYLNRLLSATYSKPNAEMPNFALKGSSTRRPNRKMENSQTGLP